MLEDQWAKFPRNLIQDKKIKEVSNLIQDKINLGNSPKFQTPGFRFSNPSLVTISKNLKQKTFAAWENLKSRTSPSVSDNHYPSVSDNHYQPS